MTSNLGSEIIHSHFEGVSSAELEQVIEQSRNQVFELLKKSMRPEFLNRIDEVVMFRPLTTDHLESIIRIQLKHLERLLQKQEITFEVTDELIQFLKEEGYDLQYGARPLKRLIQKRVIDALSLAMLEGKVGPQMHIIMDLKDRKVIFQSEDTVVPAT
jgi:ATP-dependent Clp protease ATP-binding subunit ClpB